MMKGLKQGKNTDASSNLVVPTAASNAVSWRTDGIKHTKNEVFLDVIEKLNILVSSNGTVLRSEILGHL
jgi:AP-1 complex subunit mu